MKIEYNRSSNVYEDEKDGLSQRDRDAMTAALKIMEVLDDYHLDLEVVMRNNRPSLELRFRED